MSAISARVQGRGDVGIYWTAVIVALLCLNLGMHSVEIAVSALGNVTVIWCHCQL